MRYFIGAVILVMVVAAATFAALALYDPASYVMEMLRG